MQQPGTVDINATIEAWAEIVIKIFKEKIVTLDPPLYDTGDLFKSLMSEFQKQAGDDIEKVDFTFKMYGIFQDMGVGGEFGKGNQGNVDSQRKPRPWFSSRFFREVMRLREILDERYSRAVAYHVANTLSDSFDQRYGSVAYAGTVGSLRTVSYRVQQGIRNARNYQKRRQGGGQWVGERKRYWKA